MSFFPESDLCKRPRGAVRGVRREVTAGKQSSVRKAGLRLRPQAGGLDEVDLLSNLCGVMDLFPSIGEEAIGELAGKMMADRLRREAAEKIRAAGFATPRRQSRR
jgi:hypothetical protein